MKTLAEFKANEINALSYTDFVGLLNQWNVPPGSLSTISKWRVFSNLNASSNLLEVACTTGFSSRELALSSQCKATGVDVSEMSIKAAQKNKVGYAANANLEYYVHDGCTFKGENKYSHVVIGAALKFFPEPQKLVSHIISLMDDEGYLLASPFYINEPIPADLVERFRGVFGIRPTTEGYKDVMQLYKGWEVIYQDHMDIYPETESELEHYCDGTVKRQLKEDGVTSNEIFDVCYKRLLEIKHMSNLLRPYQKYTTLVLRYRKSIYPDRYIELF